jgi:hypothetical protein
MRGADPWLAKKSRHIASSVVRRLNGHVLSDANLDPADSDVIVIGDNPQLSALLDINDRIVGNVEALGPDLG